ncbi:MAG: hypothetical protein PHX78_10880 [bacterium]|nr:hypothetical protein [bacterium]
MKYYYLIFIIFFISNINSYSANPKIEPANLDFYKETISVETKKPVLEKLPWDEIVVPAKEGRKIKILLKTKGLKEFAGLSYKIKIFRQDDYPNGKFKTIELNQTKNINEFLGEVIFIDDKADNRSENTVAIPQGDDGVLEVCSAEGAPDGGWEAEYFLEKLVKKGYKNRGNATFFSFTDEGTVEEHENEGVPVLNNEYLQSAGVEKIIIDANFDNSSERPYFITSSEWDSPGFNPAKDWLLVRNQADIFYYSFHGEHESNGALISKVLRDDWKLSKRWPAQIVPKKTRYMLDDYYYHTLNDEIGDNWNLDLEWVYLAGCSVLDYDGEITSEWANFHDAKYNSWYDTRPGLFFAKNLLNKSSGLHGIIGFAATGKSDHALIDECLNHNDSIVEGWKKNEEIFHMFLAPSILYHPEYEKDTFADLGDSNPDNNKLIYWYSYQPATYSFPQKKRVTVSKPVDLDINAPRAPDCLMVENIPNLIPNPNDPKKLIFNYYPAYFPERENISDKRFETKNLTPVLSWGYFSPEYKAAFDKEDETLNEINPGIVTFENENMKNYGVNIDGTDDRIIEQWQVQIFNTSHKLIMDKTFATPIIKSDKTNLLWEAGYKIKPEEKLNHNSLYFFRVKGKGRNGLWSPFSRIQWFKTK